MPDSDLCWAWWTLLTPMRQGQLKLKVNPLDLDYWPYGSLIVRVWVGPLTSWVTWKETNLKMKLLTETERSGCADASPWRVLMFLKIFFFFNSLKCGIFTNMIW